jgi:hypothetical protein
MKQLLWMTLPFVLALSACNVVLPDRSQPPGATATAVAVDSPLPTAPATAVAVDTPVPTATSSPEPAPTMTPTIEPLSIACPAGAAWFFTFTMEEPAGVCPGPVWETRAVGQDFEGGRVYWYAAEPADSDQRGTVFVIYNDGFWETFANMWQPDQPDYDAEIIPPPERFQPVQIIGKVWRENSEVRQRLGWAYEPQQLFHGRFQGYDPAPGGSPAADLPTFYVDHGKWQVVLGLFSVDMGPNTWLVAGEAAPVALTWLTYRNESLGFSISHPAAFDVRVDEDLPDGGRIGEQIFFTVSDSHPRDCRGPCPVLETREEVTVAGQVATKITGYIGAIGGNIPQNTVTYVFPRENLYYTFTLYAVGDYEPTDDLSVRPLRLEDVVLFRRLVETIRFHD